MTRFKAAVVGHSQVPTVIEVPDCIDLTIFRSPGAKARKFFTDPLLSPVLENRYDVVILWLGSNDITPRCAVRDIVKNIKNIVLRLEEVCTPRVKICLVEPRHPERRYAHVVSQETYDLIRKGVNNNLQRRALRGKEFISFGARPYEGDLGRDGVHFNREGRSRIAQKLGNAIRHSMAFQPEAHWGWTSRNNKQS